MEFLEVFGAGNGSGEKLAGALLFMAGGQNVLGAISALNSSPWTAENSGADDAKRASCREYVLHGIGVSAFYAVIAAVVSHSWWPIMGAAIMDAYLWWVYARALERGVASGSQGFPNIGNAAA